MRVCVYVCMCVYVYYIQYICMCMYICICVWVCVCACACVYVYVHVNVHVYVYVHEARAMSTVHACTMMVCHNTLSVHAIAIARPTCMNVFPIIANTCSTAFWPALSNTTQPLTQYHISAEFDPSSFGRLAHVLATAINAFLPGGSKL